MKCEKCGKEMDKIVLNLFDHNGCDSDYKHEYSEEDEDAVVIETKKEWVGFELSEEEQMQDIRCPHCGKFPFVHREVQVYEVVRVVCFKSPE